MSTIDHHTGLVHPLIAMACTEGDELIPFRTTTLEMVYGDMEYIKSVFGTANITRERLANYYYDAKKMWSKCSIPYRTDRTSIVRWCRSLDIRPLHYYLPLGSKYIWFKDRTDSFAFQLKFGIN